MAIQEPSVGEKWHAENEWRKQEHLARERDRQLKREENNILQGELDLKLLMSRGTRWWTPMLVTATLAALGWAVSVFAIVFGIRSTNDLENAKRANQLVDDQRKDILEASLEHRKALLKAASLAAGMTKYYVLNSTAPNKEMFEAYLPKLQDDYLEITAAYQKLYVLEPKVAAELDKPFRQLDEIVNQLSTLYTAPDFQPESVPLKWTFLNCKLEELQATTTFDPVMQFLRRPGASAVPMSPTARKGAPRDCETWAPSYLKYFADEAARRAALKSREKK